MILYLHLFLPEIIEKNSFYFFFFFLNNKKFFPTVFLPKIKFRFNFNSRANIKIEKYDLANIKKKKIEIINLYGNVNKFTDDEI